MFEFGRISLQESITVFFTLFAVIDMLGSIPILIDQKSKMEKFKPIIITLTSGFLMILFLFVGRQILALLALDVQSFAVAGSVVIFIIGLEMVLGVEFFKSEGPGSAGHVVPIAFPLIAGSGTLTTIMSLKALYFDGNILLGIILNLVVIFIVLHSLKWIENVLGDKGLMVMRKFFGVILLAIAIKIFSGNAPMLFDTTTKQEVTNSKKH